GGREEERINAENTCVADRGRSFLLGTAATALAVPVESDDDQTAGRDWRDLDRNCWIAQAQRTSPSTAIAARDWDSVGTASSGTTLYPMTRPGSYKLVTSPPPVSSMEEERRRGGWL
ncbi:hypothetical protein CLAIMM_11073, partial [Cladophialophora immunda]